MVGIAFLESVRGQSDVAVGFSVGFQGRLVNQTLSQTIPFYNGQLSTPL